MANVTFPLVQVIDPRNSGGFHNWPAVSPHQNMRWTNPGDVKVNGTTWSSNTSITANGDPTSSSGASLGINTGSNQDANTRWQCDSALATERQVRGVYFKTWTNGAKFRPRISGVCLDYATGNGQVKRVGLGYRGNNYRYNGEGNLEYEGTGVNNYYWGVCKTNTSDGAPFHDPNYKLWGITFHMETTWKTGSAEWNYCYISELRFITDGAQNSTPYYNNKYRIWGWDFK